MKSYTDISQSKKLAEILPLESADMCYLPTHIGDEHHFIASLSSYSGCTKMVEVSIEYCIPCWSLTSLLSVLPQSITKYIEGESCQKTFHLNLFRSYYHCVSYSFTPSVNDDNTLYCIGRDNWVDACVAMIEKLNELNLL